MSVLVEAPPTVQAKAAWALDTVLAAAGGAGHEIVYPSPELPASAAAWHHIETGSVALPTPAPGGLLDFGDGVLDPAMSAFWHLSRWEERTGPRDRHGRFAGASALVDPGRPPVDAIVASMRALLGLAAPEGFRVVLTHDIDTPWRWTGRGAVRAAAWRGKQALRARRVRDVAGEVRGLAEAPVHRMRGTDPNWSFERMHAIERRHGGRSTHFLLVGGTHPNDGDPAARDRVLPRLVHQLRDQGDDIGLHPSYEASDRHDVLGAERDRLAELLGAPPVCTRFHFLRHDAHRDLPALARLGFRLDTSQGYADRLGMRAGLSFPYRPYDLDADRPLDLVELPLAVMDATLGDERYLGLDARAGAAAAIVTLQRVAAVGGTVAILWHNDRFAPGYARGWDRSYDRVLSWAIANGGTLCACDDVAAVA